MTYIFHVYFHLPIAPDVSTKLSGEHFSDTPICQYILLMLIIESAIGFLQCRCERERRTGRIFFFYNVNHYDEIQTSVKWGNLYGSE